MARKAVWLKEINVLDPASGLQVGLCVYKHENGAMFAIDSSYVEQLGETETVPDPFDRMFSVELLEYGLVSYDGNSKETYTLFHEGKEVAELLVSEDGALSITNAINEFLAENHELSNTIKIQNDGDELGVIVDIYEDVDHKEGITLWFEDFYE